MPSVALVTPSYPPDLERFRLLVESLDRVHGAFKHYVILDRRDIPAFKQFASERTVIIESEALIEPWLHRWPGRANYWLSHRTLPVRGWIMQQIKKLAIANHTNEDIFINTDSDTCFIKPFQLNNFMTGGKLGLLDTDFTGGSTKIWTSVAAKLLGLDPATVTPRNHVGHLICWHRGTVLALQNHVEQVTGLPWQIAIARQLHFSEYMLYGVFVRDILGYSAAGHAPSVEPLVMGSWHQDLTTESGLNDFFATIFRETIALMIHSKDGIEVSRLRPRFESYWRQAA